MVSRFEVFNVRRLGVSLVALTALAGGSGLPAVASVEAGSARSATLASSVRSSVIVRATAGELATAEAAVLSAGGTVGHQLGIINGFAAIVPASAEPALRGSASVAELTPDGSVTLDGIDPTLGYDPTGDDGSLNSIESAIGAPQAWKAGATGQGVDVAVIDSGVSPVAGLDEPGKVINGPDLSIDAGTPGLSTLDAFGHGTHMASIIAGRDNTATTVKQFSDPSQFVGIAPNAGIVNVKVGAANGAVDVSQVIAGIDWVVQNATSNGLNIKVLNLSFGTNSVQAYTLDPLDYAAEVAWRHGIVVVASAGNDGFATTSLEDPANDPFVIAVGAENTDTGGVVHGASVASFTNTGNSDRTVDVLAPGVHVLGLRDPGSVLDTTYPSAEVGSRFFRGSGTSQATAIVSGAVALLAQEYPTATPDELKYLLTSTAQPLKGVSSLSQGAGVIQVGKASAVTAAQLQKALQQSPKGSKVTPKELGTSELSQVAQPWVLSTGTGTLDGARGGSYLTDGNGESLQGQHDVWGGAFDSASLAGAEASGSAWAGATWNGNQLLGVGFSPLLWDGTSTAAVDPTSSSWDNMRWANMRWAGSGWANMRWAGSGWDNMRWAGTTWQ